MGSCLADAAMARGHQVVIVSGPVEVTYPSPAEVINVVSTEEMLDVARREFEKCDGIIGVAAPCDYRPIRVEDQKIAKTGEGLVLRLVETEDVIATLGAEKGSRWVVGFALETEDHRFRAITKAERKSCDLMVLNSPAAMNAQTTDVEILDPDGTVLAQHAGMKSDVAAKIIEIIEERLR